MRIIVLILFVSNLVFAQQPLSIQDAIGIGLENNFQIQIAKRNEEIARNNNNYGAAGRYPTVDLNLSSANGFTRSNNPASFVPESSTINAGLTPSIDANWTIFDGFKVSINKNRLEELERQSLNASAVAIENTILAIIQSYNQALIQREQLGVLQEVLQLSRDRIEYQEVRKEFGQAGRFDVLQSRDAFLNDSTNLVLQKHTYATAIRNLNLAMGVDELEQDYTLTDALVYDGNLYAYEDLEAKMLADNNNLKNLYIAQRLASIETEFQESNRYPRVGVGAGLSQNFSFSKINATNPFTGDDFGSINSRAFNAYVNLNATYNIFDGGNKKRSIENAKVEEMIAQLNINDFKRSLSSQLRNTLATYNNQVQLLQMTENLLANARENLEISEERFKAGQVNSFDYRTIQLAFINAAQSRLTAIFNLKNTETELVRLIGGLVK